MGYPDMDQDETILLESRNVKFKSISFDAILTNKRIHLTDSKKNVIPSQDITLTSIRNVERGENAIRDHFIILSLITDAGEKHQMVLTFARQSGMERKRECNEWAKKLKSLIPPPAPVISRSEVPLEEKELLVKREVPIPAQGTAASTRPAKKRIEITRPTRTGIEKSPVAPEPVETVSPPSFSYCSRCGNHVPLKSTFCNHCGTPIDRREGLGQETKPAGTKVQEAVQPPTPQPAGTKVKEAVQPPVPQPAGTKVKEAVQPPIPQPAGTKVKESVQPPIPQPAGTKVKEAVPPPGGSPGEHERSGIAPIIHPIEPLIKDSVPPTRQYSDLVQPSEPSSTESLEGSSPLVVWPVFAQTEFPAGPPQKAAPAGPAPSLPRLIPVPKGKKPNYSTMGILIIAILPILIGLIIVANLMSGPSVSPANTTPVIPITTTILNQTTPQEIIPSSGVWVRASYAGTYIGLIGTPGNQTEVNDTGDHFYPIPTGAKTVAAALQKKDSSENQIILEVYNNGVMLKRETSIAPKAIVEIQLDIKT